MEVVRIDHSKALPPEHPEWFEGTVHLQPLHEASAAGDVRLSAVFFAAGARTLPHAHGTTQVLHVVAGEGVVATEARKQVVRPGDVVVIPAHTWHWHGATPEATMCHISERPVGPPDDWDCPLLDWDTYMDGAEGT